MSNKEDNIAVGLRIRNLRESKKLTREALSGLSGVSTQFQAAIETGSKSMTIQTLRKLASALNVSTDFIVYGVNNSREASPIDKLIQGLSQYQITCAHEILRQYAAAIHAGAPSDGGDE